MTTAANTQQEATQDETVQPISALKKVEDLMVESLRERGPEHFLEWIGQWFSRVENAKVLDYLGVARAAEMTEKDRAWCLKELLSLTQFPVNGSSSVGVNQLAQARILVMRELCRGRVLSDVQETVIAAIE